MQPSRPSRLGLFRIHDRLLPVALNVPARRRITYAKETASKTREALSLEPSSFHGDSSNGD
jgi:hypothetical protein